MEAKRNIALRGAESFSRGELDNVALQDGALILDEVAGRHVLYGCYTGPEFAMPPFCNLNISWNADTPHGTVVETRCRVYAGGEWSGWMGFGKWSPEYPRASTRSTGEGSQMVFVMGDTVTVAIPGGGTAVQIRVYMYTDDERVTPVVRLLAAAVRPLQWNRQPGEPVNRRLYLPEYCIASHDLRFGRSMDLPLTLAALINRYGEDLLPEELAFGMSDAATGSCRNAAYAAALAGACGYESYQAWMDLRDLRSEIRAGNSCAVEIEQGVSGRTGSVVWMGLRGFGHDPAVLADYVILNDPAAESEASAVRTMALRDFERYFTGRALVLHARAVRGRACRPLHLSCAVRPGGAPGEYRLEYRGAPSPLPDNFRGWLACAARDGVAHATTAHKHFVRVERSDSGGFVLPPALWKPGALYTFYAVDETAVLRVAELQLPAVLPPEMTPPAAQTAAEPAAAPQDAGAAGPPPAAPLA